MFLEPVMRACLRRRIRGSWRFAQFAARHLSALQKTRIEIHGSPPVVVDLRIPGMLQHFERSPYATPPWEPEQQLLMRRLVKPGDIAYDVGANVGLHMVFLSVLVGPEGHVHAFEANTELHEVLRATVAGLTNTTLHEFGLSERDEMRQLVVPENRETASLVAWSGEAATTRPCELRSLNALVASGTIARPDFIKCDIEGAELAMLRGGRSMLDSDDAPIILSEANAQAARAFGYVSNEIPRFLADLAAPRYAIFVEDTPSRWVRRTSFSELNQYILAVPEARLARWPGLAESEIITLADGSASLG
jgi:FkbM family methyltransferase